MSALRRRLLLAVFAMLLLDPATLVAQCPTATLSPNAPQVISCNPTAFSLVPTPGHWNAVSIGSNANWNLTLLPAISYWTAGWVDFVVSNGHLGSPAVTSGLVDCLTTPIQPAKVLHCTAAALTVNSPTTVTIAANSSIQIVEFEIQAFGNYYVDATGSGGLRWAVYAPSTNANWRPRDTSIADGIVGSGGGVALFPGWHALVLTHEGFPTLGPIAVDVSVTCGTQPLPMSQNSTVSVSQPCQYFHAAPGQGVWNVIGINSASNWDLTVLGVTSSIGGSVCDAVVANGHLGFVPGGPSNFSRQSGTTGASAVHAVNTTPLTLGAATQSTWSTSTVMQVFEFQVTQTGAYDISVTGLSSLGWDLYLPGASSAWRPRSTAVAGGSVPSTLSNYALAAGWHAIVVRTDSGVGVSGSIAVTVAQHVNAVPTVSTINPSKVPAGGYGFTLHVLGSGFVASSVVRLGGQPLPTTWVNAGNLDAQVPASMIAQPANATVEVFTPAPGGGTATAALSIALPKITGISPTSIPAPLTSGGISPFVIGEMFGGFSDVYANGVLLSSNYVALNPPLVGKLDFNLSASLPQAQAEGAIAITVVNYGFQSNSYELVIGSGGNAGTVITDPPAPAAGASFSIRIDGGIPGQPVTLVASLPPASPWTLAGTPFLIGLDPGSLIPVVDGLGIFGAAGPAVLGSPPPFTPATYPGGVFVLPGITMPAPAAGIDLVLQAVYGNPSSPTGFSLTWARWPLSL